ncbi:MAG: GGDEF domain-containing protein [Sulfurovum sp.]|nr:GGDEF domain-containing protein [Sulfurovum sp.]
MGNKKELMGYSDKWIHGLNRRDLVLVTTFVSILFSLAIFLAVSFLLGTPLHSQALIMTIFIPAIVASSLSFYLVTMIQQIQTLEDNILKMATLDEVTGLMSRPAFLCEVRKLHEKALKQKNSLAVIYIDVDDFKNINDLHGHAAGDDALSYIGSAMESACTSQALVGRLGGDEVAISLCDVSLEKILEILKTFRFNLSVYDKNLPDKHKIKLTTSIGISYAYPSKTGLSFNAMLAQADKALYYAKHHGKDCVVLHGKHGKPEILLT